jgi:hypothetical protein
VGWPIANERAFGVVIQGARPVVPLAFFDSSYRSQVAMLRLLLPRE